MSYAEWSPTAYYLVNDVVYDNALAYQCLAQNGPPTPQQPSVSPLFWAELSVADITAVLGGTGISVSTPGGPTPTVNNTGVLAVGGGTGISIGGTAQNPTVDNTGVLSVTAGTGISIGGTAQNPTVDNVGVLSLDGAVGTVTTKVGGAYKSVAQNLASGNTFITWDSTFAWNDTGYITQTAADTFTVNVKGLYQLEHQIAVTPNAAVYGTGTNKGAAIMLTRSPIAEQVIATQNALEASAQPYGFAVPILFELLVGDTIRCRHSNTFTGGPPSAAGLLNTFDYNTTFTWRLVKPLP